jgi:hypothetical protein
MWLKNNIRELLAAVFGIAFIVFTGLRIIPTEAFVGVAVAIVMWYFEEKSKENLRKEIDKLKGEQHHG